MEDLISLIAFHGKLHLLVLTLVFLLNDLYGRHYAKSFEQRIIRITFEHSQQSVPKYLCEVIHGSQKTTQPMAGKCG